jgi:trehalose-6-phosphate synthase
VRRTPSDLHYGDRKLIAKEFPIGIDTEEFKASMATEETRAEMVRLRAGFQDRKIILGIDRLDYIKGIPQKLHAFDKMLRDNQEWADKVVLVQVCVPTRSTVTEYKKLRSEVEELVGRINGNHSMCLHNFLKKS